MGMIYVLYGGLIFLGALAGYGLFSLLVLLGIPSNVLLTLLAIMVIIFLVVGITIFSF